MKKYWQGPGGVFYNPKRDVIFTLEHTGTRIYDFKVGKDKGPMFEYRERGHYYRCVAVTCVEDAVRLGDL